ncbi:MAG: helix-turn-helix domain-containing protein [Desulfobacterales bacterium]|jgi:predicted HTH transcriptional regulator|nr:helix-turn-helix domain-containing protein [Desulfobacterales bacterium]
MQNKLNIFVSSVQKELEDERVIIQNLLSTDAFLSAHTAPVLYEYEPASADKALDGCIRTLKTCQVYVLIVASQYGKRVGKLSITHTEYQCAKKAMLPILAFIKGDRSLKREDGTEVFLKELDDDGFKYKRFGNVVELQKEVRAAVLKLLKERFGISPSSDENQIAEQTIEATSAFESQLLKRIPWKKLDHQVARRMIAAAESSKPEKITQPQLIAGASLRGLVWHDSASGEHYATAAGIVMLAKDPSAVFPHCRILADAYRGNEPDGDPRDHEDIRLPMPLAVDRAIAFIDRNTRHPMRIVGLNRVRLDEYPSEALREALVNAVAHRQYEDAGRKIMLEVFSDRVVVSSPGLPPAPITLASLRKGRYRPCSRNPVLAQCLSYFHRIEERGSGFRRMRDQTLEHGLDAPEIGTDTGYFQVVFPGPQDNIERLKAPMAQLVVTPTIEAQLNKRQKKMLKWLAEGEELTSRRCEAEFGITRPIAAQDFAKLTELGLAERVGAGRSTRYRYKAGT